MQACSPCVFQQRRWVVPSIDRYNTLNFDSHLLRLVGQIWHFVGRFGRMFSQNETDEALHDLHGCNQ